MEDLHDLINIGFFSGAEQGRPGLDHSAMAKALELFARHEIAKPHN